MHLSGWQPLVCLVLLSCYPWCRREKIYLLFLKATWSTKSSGIAFLTSHYVYCSHLSGLQTLGFLSVCHSALLWALVKQLLCFQFSLGSGTRCQGQQDEPSRTNKILTAKFRGNSTILYWFFFSSRYLIKFHFTLEVYQRIYQDVIPKHQRPAFKRTQVPLDHFVQRRYVHKTR